MVPIPPAHTSWESFIIRLDILNNPIFSVDLELRIFHYSPWYTYRNITMRPTPVENLSLFALIYLDSGNSAWRPSWESFIIRLDILTHSLQAQFPSLRIFHYSPWYTYDRRSWTTHTVENLSLFALIYLALRLYPTWTCWESFIIRLDILNICGHPIDYAVENLSLFALIYLT